MEKMPADFSAIRRLLVKEFAPYRLLAVFALIFLAIASLSAALAAWMMKFIIDDIFIAKDAQMVIWVCLGIAAIYLSKGITTYIAEVLLARVSALVTADMRQKVIDSLLNQDMSFYAKTETADLVNRISNATQSTAMLIRLLITSGTRDLLTAVFLFGYMIYLDWILTISTLIIAPTVIWAVGRITRRIRDRMQSEFEWNSHFMQLLYERFQGIGLIKAFGAEEPTQRIFDDTITTLRRRAFAIGRLSAMSSPMMEMLGGFAVAAIIAYAGYAVISLNATPGEFMSFLVAFVMVYEPVKRLTRFRVELVRYVVALNYYYELIDTKPKQISGDKDYLGTLPQVRFHNVDFAYEPSTPVLKKLNFVAEAGKMTAIVGSSGAGKSTIFHLLQRMNDPQFGQIFIDDIPIEELKISALRKLIAPIPQDTIIFTDSIENNITFGLDYTQDAIEKAEIAANMDEFLQKLPQKGQTLIGDGYSALSGGQKQRLSIARAFLKNAPLLLLDEATSALDSHSEAKIQKAIKQVSQGRTVIVIAHRLSTIRHADKILVMDKGELVEEGNHDELMALNGAYAALAKQQFA